MDEVEQVLNAALQHLDNNELAEAFSILETGLGQLRRQLPSDEWKDACRRCISHPISKYIYQDPLTKWAYDKPRGYPGDAVLMDFIYGWPAIEKEVSSASKVGRAINEFIRNAASVAAVRARLNLLVELIDELPKTTAGPQILSIASGHVREAHLAKAVKEGAIRRFVALDQDEATMKLVATELHSYGVETITKQVRTIVMGKCVPGSFDLIYSVGLSDYLPTRVTERLISRMFSMLNPGGQLLIPNFLPNTVDSGFMEAFMDWHLIYRDADEMLALAKNLPQKEIGEKRIFADPTDNIVFLQITKAKG